ncbi:ARM repeat-containing protein [Thelephora ganbajun]|uniref:ARM repeat-containing protein n=1 Tax=Thelephora ganbajun TaxID=370292 RepID=A0ACB6ZP60_THEGA|nr:ARM repeat-containing protein [Thelephora ganbajun]
MVMAIGTPINVKSLRALKNTVIGNPSAKASLARDEAFVRVLVGCLNEPGLYAEREPGTSAEAIRIEAAHVISSLAYGEPNGGLGSLLRANAHQAFLYALSNFTPEESTIFKAAFTRGLRVLAVAFAECVGPSQWGLKPESSQLRHEAKFALETLFKTEVLDVYIPLLEHKSPQIVISIALMLTSTLCTQIYRTKVTEWLPPSERAKETKGKRGWERPNLIDLRTKQGGGWVAKRLSTLLHSKDVKIQEAALGALGSLVQDNSVVALTLARPLPDKDKPGPLSALQTVLGLCKSRTTDVSLAACLCATFMIRSSVPNNHYPVSGDHTASLTVLHILNRVIGNEAESPQTRKKACFILYYFVTDDKDLCMFAYERGSLTKLSQAVDSITPTDKPPIWEEEESEHISSLREAALSAIAALSLWNNDIRREVAENYSLIATIRASLSHPHTGVRFAACQCVRALSRLVAVVRTSLVDSGLGMKVYGVFLNEDEDRRVMFAASSVICNLVNDFSPLRPVMLEQRLIARLVDLTKSDDRGLRLNALWAFKNLLHKSSSAQKQTVMTALGWNTLSSLLVNPDPGLQEQAFHIARHLAESEEDVETLFSELGTEPLFNCIAPALETDNGDILLQATCLLANLANGSSQRQISITSDRRIMASVRSCLVDSNVYVRRPAASCVLQLAKNSRCQKVLRDVGFDSTLRHMCDFGGGMTNGSPGPLSHQMGVEDDVGVKEKAREALALLEYGEFTL